MICNPSRTINFNQTLSLLFSGVTCEANAIYQTKMESSRTGRERMAPIGQTNNNNNNSGNIAEELKSCIDKGETKRVLELLKLGVPLVMDRDGQTALHLAASAGNYEMVEALIQAGCDVGIQDFVSDVSSVLGLILVGTWVTIFIVSVIGWCVTTNLKNIGGRSICF